MERMGISHTLANLALDSGNFDKAYAPLLGHTNTEAGPNNRRGQLIRDAKSSTS